MAANDDARQPWKFFPKPGELPPPPGPSDAGSPPFGLESAPLDSGSASAVAPIPDVPARPLVEIEPVSEVAQVPTLSDLMRASEESRLGIRSVEATASDASAPVASAPVASESDVSESEVRRPGPSEDDTAATWGRDSKSGAKRPGGRSSARLKRGSSPKHAAARTHSGGAHPAARRGRSTPASGALVGVFGALGVAALILMIAHQGSSDSESAGHEEPVQAAHATPAPVRPTPVSRPAETPPTVRRPVVAPTPDDETVAPERTDLVPAIADDDPNMPGSRQAPGQRRDLESPDTNRPDGARPDAEHPDANQPDANRPETPDRPEGASPAASPDPAHPSDPKLRPGEVLEHNPDGSIKARYSTDKEGRKSGSYIEYHPNGKIAVKATYRQGELHGTRTELSPTGRVLKRAAYRQGELHGESLVADTNGHVLSQEYWFEGLLLYPKTQEAIERRLHEIGNESIEGPAGAPKLTDFVPYSAEGQIKALRKLKAFRYLCDVSTDVTLSRPYGELASAAAQLLEIVGHLDHNPERPTGVPDSLYVPGLQGLQEGNLHEHSERRGDALLLGGIDFWIWDSDPTNIGRVGHRRWSLNPRMKEVAWGVRSKFTVMYSHDSARDAKARDFVAYPSRGFFPIPYLEKDAAWSCAFDQGPYNVASSAKVEVCAADDKLRKGPPAEIHDFAVESGGYAQGSAVIFRPEVTIAAGARYWVTITGVTDAAGKPVRVQYLVELTK